jgi:hypothetical protein
MFIEPTGPFESVSSVGAQCLVSYISLLTELKKKD